MSENFEELEDLHECEGCKKQIPIEFDLCSECADRLFPSPYEDMTPDEIEVEEFKTEVLGFLVIETYLDPRYKNKERYIYLKPLTADFVETSESLDLGDDEKIIGILPVHHKIIRVMKGSKGNDYSENLVRYEGLKGWIRG